MPTSDPSADSVETDGTASSSSGSPAPSATAADGPSGTDGEKKATSRDWAKLVAKERELTQKATELKELEQNSQKIQEIVQAFKMDPVGALRQMAETAGIQGDAYAYITEAMLNGGQVTQTQQTDAVAQRIEKLENELNEYREKATQTEAQKQAEQIVTDYKAKLTTFNEENADQYPLLAGLGRTDLVFQRAVAYSQNTGGDPPDFPVLFEEVEKGLAEEVNALLPTLLGIPSIQETVRGLLEKSTADDKSDHRHQVKEPPTPLTNGSDTALPPRDKSEPMTEREAIARAAARLSSFGKSGT